MLKPLFLFRGVVNEKLWDSTTKPLTKEINGVVYIEGALTLDGYIQAQSDDSVIYKVKVKEETIEMKINDRWSTKTYIKETFLIS